MNANYSLPISTDAVVRQTPVANQYVVSNGVTASNTGMNEMYRPVNPTATSSINGNIQQQIAYSQVNQIPNNYNPNIYPNNSNGGNNNNNNVSMLNRNINTGNAGTSQNMNVPVPMNMNSGNNNALSNNNKPNSQVVAINNGGTLPNPMVNQAPNQPYLMTNSNNPPNAAEINNYLQMQYASQRYQQGNSSNQQLPRHKYLNPNANTTTYSNAPPLSNNNNVNVNMPNPNSNPNSNPIPNSTNNNVSNVNYNTMNTIIYPENQHYFSTLPNANMNQNNYSLIGLQSGMLLDNTQQGNNSIANGNNPNNSSSINAPISGLLSNSKQLSKQAESD